MLVSLLFLAATTVATSPAVPASTQDDPPVRVWFNSGGDYGFTDRAKVYVKSAENGYLVVLRADGDGRVRVLFPVDPTDDQRVIAGNKYQLKGRGGRETFIADDTGGHGTVLAAISSTPFRVRDLDRDGRWDIRSLSHSESEEDAESRLVRLVRGMKPAGEPIVYAVATYVVSERFTRGRYPDPYAGLGWWGYDPWWGYGPRLGGFWYRGWYRPW